MSYYNRIKKYLNPVGEQDSDFYIKATKDALDKYFKDLRKSFSSSSFKLNGTVVIGNYSYPIVDMPGGNVVSTKILTPNELNLKTAMWTTPPENCFPNLFDEIGLSISRSFTFVSGQPSVSGPMMPLALNTSHFRAFGLQFMAKIKTIGQNLNADIFHQTLSEYIEKAIKMITPMTIPISGIWIAGGMFSGTVMVNFNDARL
jgi:hypothetical protein